MKEFNLEEAKAGARVFTRQRTKVEILKFDARITGLLQFPIIALVWDEIRGERHDSLMLYDIYGHSQHRRGDCDDLMIEPAEPIFTVDLSFADTWLKK